MVLPSDARPARPLPEESIELNVPGTTRRVTLEGRYRRLHGSLVFVPSKPVLEADEIMGYMHWTRRQLYRRSSSGQLPGQLRSATRRSGRRRPEPIRVSSMAFVAGMLAGRPGE